MCVQQWKRQHHDLLLNRASRDEPEADDPRDGADDDSRPVDGTEKRQEVSSTVGGYDHVLIAYVPFLPFPLLGFGRGVDAGVLPFSLSI
jgi:hypothetical protein